MNTLENLAGRGDKRKEQKLTMATLVCDEVNVHEFVQELSAG
jgi:hypothetical protein